MILYVSARSVTHNGQQEDGCCGLRHPTGFRRLEVAHLVVGRRLRAGVGAVNRQLAQVADVTDEGVVLLLLRPPRHCHLGHKPAKAQRSEHSPDDGRHSAPLAAVVVALLRRVRPRHHLARRAQRPDRLRRPVLRRKRPVTHRGADLRRRLGCRRLRRASDGVLDEDAVLRRRRLAEGGSVAAGSGAGQRHAHLLLRELHVPRERDVHGPRRQARRLRHALTGHQHPDKRHDEHLGAPAQRSRPLQQRAAHPRHQRLRVFTHLVRVARQAQTHLRHVRRDRRASTIHRPLPLHPRRGTHTLLLAARGSCARRRARNIVLTAAVRLLLGSPERHVGIAEAVVLLVRAANTVLRAAGRRGLSFPHL
eukprot:Rhum_TRINITY_DN15073_c0_g5::Rhum_TRINITY_DN15073_c0_g5_i2::g.136523::m.136523